MTPPTSTSLPVVFISKTEGEHNICNHMHSLQKAPFGFHYGFGGSAEE